MKSRLKTILICSSIIVLGFVCFIIYGLHLMEIEDRYGDLQEIYFEGKTGDLIVNNENGNIGKLELENTEILVEDNSRKFKLIEWLNSNQKVIILEIYRTKNPDLFLNLTPQKFKEKIKVENAERIIQLNLNYQNCSQPPLIAIAAIR
ncbi:MAG: hypothetical protein EOO46_11970 [Flavobacterium sp.]|nr:MAG: hypothetical protein EOO46_11970 [Flavobacterium sp.]